MRQRGLGHMSKLATMPIKGKTPQNTFSQHPTAIDPEDLDSTKCVQLMIVC